jgi:hypothetical protein
MLTTAEMNMLDPSSASNLDSIAPGVSDIVTGQQQNGESWADTLQRVLPMLAATVQQQQLLSVQVDRARQGLPPLNVSQYAAGAQVGLSADTKTFLMIGAGALAAVWLLPQLLKGARR